jgi:hypothetical protein
LTYVFFANCCLRIYALKGRYQQANLVGSFSGPDPNPSVEFLRSGQTLSYDILVFRFYEAAVRDLRQSAISCPWRLHLNFSRQVESNGGFSAIKLIARISGAGLNHPFAYIQK